MDNTEFSSEDLISFLLFSQSLRVSLNSPSIGRSQNSGLASIDFVPHAPLLQYK